MNNEVRVPGGKVESRFRGAAKAKAGLGIESGPDSWKQGYLFGSGVEHAFSGGVSAKIEYNYVINNAVPTTSGGISSKSDLDDNVIKAGINGHESRPCDNFRTSWPLTAFHWAMACGR